MRELTCHDVAERLQNDGQFVVVDVREDWELEICAVAGAVHIPLGQLAARKDELDPDMPVALLCHHGVRSRYGAILLADAGFKDVFNITGGIDVWALEVAPDMARYD